MSFSGKVVLVTGASAGIGAAAALAFAREGARVVIVGRNQKSLDDVAASFVDLTPPLVLRVDVANDKQAATIIQRTIDHFGRLDVLVNNAGIFRNASILEGNILAVYDEVMATNLRATIHIASLAAPELLKTKGNIINISGAAGLKTMPIYFTAYSISKAGLNHFSKSLALELAPHGVRVNVISPGPVRTNILETSGIPASWDDFKEMTPLKRVGEVEEIAELILFLASDKAKGITGGNYVSDNGFLLT